jgi:transcriptional antiterminator
MGQWVTVKEASVILGMSERTLRRHIQQSKVKSRVTDKRRYVLIGNDDMVDHDQDHVSDIDDHVNTEQGELQSGLIQQLKSENENLRKQVDQQQAIIMQLSRNQQLMLESAEQKKARQSWWSRLWKKDNI